MTRFTVDTDELDTAVASLAAMVALSEKLLTEVEALAATVSSEWSSEAGARFVMLKEEWAQGAQQMSDGIQVIHQATTASHANYQAAVSAASRIW